MPSEPEVLPDNEVNATAVLDAARRWYDVRRIDGQPWRMSRRERALYDAIGLWINDDEIDRRVWLALFIDGIPILFMQHRPEALQWLAPIGTRVTWGEWSMDQPLTGALFDASRLMYEDHLATIIPRRVRAEVMSPTEAWPGHVEDAAEEELRGPDARAVWQDEIADYQPHVPNVVIRPQEMRVINNDGTSTRLPITNIRTHYGPDSRGIQVEMTLSDVDPAILAELLGGWTVEQCHAFFTDDDGVVTRCGGALGHEGGHNGSNDDGVVRRWVELEDETFLPSTAGRRLAERIVAAEGGYAAPIEPTYAEPVNLSNEFPLAMGGTLIVPANLISYSCPLCTGRGVLAMTGDPCTVCGSIGSVFRCEPCEGSGEGSDGSGLCATCGGQGWVDGTGGWAARMAQLPPDAPEPTPRRRRARRTPRDDSASQEPETTVSRETADEPVDMEAINQAVAAAGRALDEVLQPAVARATRSMSHLAGAMGGPAQSLINEARAAREEEVRQSALAIHEPF